MYVKFMFLFLTKIDIVDDLGTKAGFGKEPNSQGCMGSKVVRVGC